VSYHKLCCEELYAFSLFGRSLTLLNGFAFVDRRKVPIVVLFYLNEIFSKVAALMLFIMALGCGLVSVYAPEMAQGHHFGLTQFREDLPDDDKESWCHEYNPEQKDVLFDASFKSARAFFFLAMAAMFPAVIAEGFAFEGWRKKMDKRVKRSVFVLTLFDLAVVVFGLLQFVILGTKSCKTYIEIHADPDKDPVIVHDNVAASCSLGNDAYFVLSGLAAWVISIFIFYMLFRCLEPTSDADTEANPGPTPHTWHTWHTWHGVAHASTAMSTRSCPCALESNCSTFGQMYYSRKRRDDG